MLEVPTSQAQASQQISLSSICEYYKQYGQLPPFPPRPPCPWFPPCPPPPPFPPPPPPPPTPPCPDCEGFPGCSLKPLPKISANCYEIDLDTFEAKHVSDVDPSKYKAAKILFRELPGGEFTMGSPSDEIGRYSQKMPDVLDFESQKTVFVSKFYAGVFPVTQKQYEKVTGIKHGDFVCPEYYSGDSKFRMPCRAKDFVSWEDAVRFVEKLNEKLRRTTLAISVDLPSDAEWEYMCRAGSSKPWGADDVSAEIVDLSDVESLKNTRKATNLEKYASYLNGRDARCTMHDPNAFPSVGTFLPNAWDIYDTHGCVWEWTKDDWRITNLKEGKTDWLDPDGIAAKLKTVRGGGYWFNADDCRCANRHGYKPDHRWYGFGFRLILKTIS